MTITQQVEDRMKYEFEELADRYKKESDWEIKLMALSKTLEEKAEHIHKSHFYKSLSKSYSMLAVEVKKHVMIAGDIMYD